MLNVQSKNVTFSLFFFIVVTTGYHSLYGTLATVFYYSLILGMLRFSHKTSFIFVRPYHDDVTNVWNRSIFQSILTL